MNTSDLLKKLAKLYYNHKRDWFNQFISGGIVKECKKNYKRSWSKLSKKEKEEIRKKVQEFINIMREQ